MATRGDGLDQVIAVVESYIKIFCIVVDKPAIINTLA